MAALERAVPVAECEHPSVPVAEHLCLHVPGAEHQPLEEHACRAEAGGRDPLHALERLGQLCGARARRHPDAATAAGRLEHHRVADSLRRLAGGVEVGELVAAGDQRHPGRTGQFSRRVLGPEQLDLAWCRAYPDDARLLHRARERRVLGQKPVTRMDRAGPSGLGGREHSLGHQIAFPRARGAEPHRRVGHVHVRRTPVGVGEHRDRAQPKRAGAANDPAGDLAPVGDQQRVETASHAPGAHSLPSGAVITLVAVDVTTGGRLRSCRRSRT